MGKLLSNMKIGVKLTVGFGIATLFLAIVFVTALINMSRINSDVDLVVNDRFPKTVLANEIIDAVNDNARALRNMIIANDPEVQKETYKRFDWAKELVNKNLAKLEEMIHTEKGKELLNKLKTARYDYYFPARDKLLKEYEAGNNEKVKEILLGDLRKGQNMYIDAISELIKYQTELTQEDGQHAIEAYNSAKTTMIIVGILALIFVTAFGIVLTKNISIPVNKVKDRMAQLDAVCLTNLGNGLTLMAKGDLSAKVEKATKQLNMERNDEIGQMAKVFDAMLTKAQAGIDAYEVTRAKINKLSDELYKLIEDAKNGLLDNRGDEKKFEGIYRELIAGFNQTLDAVIHPVQEGSKVLEIMATGDFTPRITADYKGQHRLIKDSINKLGDSVGRILREVSEAVHATASASAQISSSTEELAAGTQEQSAQIGEIASAVNQMTATIVQTTKHAGEAASTAKQAGDNAKKGGEAVEKTIEGINKVAKVVIRAAGVVDELGKSSEQIGEIVKVIDDIADQTNLLALNAAIEAARAGEQGRGFAVVADEVRKLAERTTKATKEIANMIKKIQVDTKEAVTSMNEGTKEVEVGITLAQGAGEALQQIIEAVVKVSDIINQVAAASEEQSSAAEQISKNIELITSVTHETASGTQQIARAAEDLNRLTNNLQDLIQQFKVDNGGDSKYYVKDNGKLLIGNKRA